MSSDIDQRHIATSRVRIDDEELSPSLMTPNPDDEITDLSLQSLPPVHADARQGDPSALTDFSEEITDRGAGPFESPWRLNALGIALIAALVFALAGMVVLRIKLNHTRAALAEAESAEEAAESAVARDPVEVAQPAPTGASATASREAAASSADATTPTEKQEQLILLLTVGTEHFAQKQLRAFKEKCSAPLAVYRQRRGRCAYSQCFAVAVPASDAEEARACGRVSRQAVRDRDDFIATP